MRCRSRSLNEGRGRNPGELRAGFGLGVDDLRSTKAGAETPATVGGRPALRLEQERSTKAGAETPATVGGDFGEKTGHITLNEGRGRNPGDSRRCSGSRSGRPALNEGRGRNPGDRPSGTLTSHTPLTAQRRPGQKPRRQLCGFEHGGSLPDRSTKAGAETPATVLTRREAVSQRNHGAKVDHHPLLEAKYPGSGAIRSCRSRGTGRPGHWTGVSGCCPGRGAKNHRRFADGSDHPRPTEFVLRISAEATPRICDRPNELIDQHGITAAVHRVLEFALHVREPSRRESALED